MEQSFADLIRSAIDMLTDRSKLEQDLIYHISKLGDEERAAVIIAYRLLYEWDDK